MDLNMNFVCECVTADNENADRFSLINVHCRFKKWKKFQNLMQKNLLMHILF